MLCVNVILIYYMVSLNTRYLVIKVNVLGHFNIIAAILNKKLLVTICAKTSCWKARSIPLNIIIPTSQEPNSYFSTSTSPCLASANVKLGYYHSIFVGVSAEDITFSARYCSFIMSLWWLGSFLTLSVNSSGAHCVCLTSLANYLHTQILD